MIENRKWFSIVELLVAIIIFTIWFLSAYLLIYSAINSSIRSKNEIIASNIAREQIELIKNIRDTNWLRNNLWNDLSEINWDWKLWDFKYYIIENNFTDSSPIKISSLEQAFDWSREKILKTDKIRLCIDENTWKYFHDCQASSKRTSFYSFVKIEPLLTKNWSASLKVDNAFKISSVVVNTERWYVQWEIQSMISDWKK